METQTGGGLLQRAAAAWVWAGGCVGVCTGPERGRGFTRPKPDDQAPGGEHVRTIPRGRLRPGPGARGRRVWRRRGACWLQGWVGRLPDAGCCSGRTRTVSPIDLAAPLPPDSSLPTVSVCSRMRHDFPHFPAPTSVRHPHPHRPHPTARPLPHAPLPPPLPSPPPLLRPRRCVSWCLARCCRSAAPGSCGSCCSCWQTGACACVCVCGCACVRACVCVCMCVCVCVRVAVC